MIEEKSKSMKIFNLLTIIIIVIIVIAVSFISFKLIKMSSTKTSSEVNETEQEINQSEPIEEELDIESDENESSDSFNVTEFLESQQGDYSVPNPVGSVTLLDRESLTSEYYCNSSVKPEHGVRIYTYKIIKGVKTLSDNYIESGETDKICDSYGSNMSDYIKYEIEWQWDSTEKIDGYRVYQYYVFKNVSRDYDYYVDLNSQAWRIIDYSLDLWTKESSANPVVGSQNSSNNSS